MSGKKRKKRKTPASHKKLTKRNVLSGKAGFDIHRELHKAVQYLRSGQLHRAKKIYKKILAVNPHDPNTLHLLGAMAHQAAQNDLAVNLFNKAIRNDPQNPVYHNDLGNAFQDQGKLDEAISCYQKALELKPDYAAVYNNMGNTYLGQGKLDEAISCYQKAVQLEPDLAEFRYNMGNARRYQGKLDEAISCYQKAIALKPDYVEACSNLIFQLQRTCAWEEVESLGAKLDVLTGRVVDTGTGIAESPFISLTRHADPYHNFTIARSWSYNTARSMSNLKIHFSLDVGRSYEGKIAVGYLSSDFRDHPVAHLMLSLFGLHSRDEFEIICYSYGRDDGSYCRSKIQQTCDKFVDLYQLNNADAARRIHKDGVGILVDLKGYTGESKLEICVLRPAPIQVSYLGFPGTTGADFLDYIITDRIITPEDQAPYYSEKFAYLPHCYQVNDNAQAISNKGWKKRDAGLSEDDFVFCSFNQPYKIEPVMFDVWMKILRQVPEGILWLSWESENTERNLRQQAEARGVEPDRLIFANRLPLNEHLARLSLADLALDTRIYNGGATTSNALWVGVPVITLQGSRYVSRMSSSMLKAIALPELITYSLEDYEALAVRFAHHPGELQTVRQKLSKNRLTEPLFDTPRFTRNLEEAYKEMWKIFLAGQRPRQIEVLEN